MEKMPFEQLQEFIKTFGGSLDPRLWLKLIKEETLELEAEIAYGNKLNALKELADCLYVLAGFGVVVSDNFENLIPEEEAKYLMRTMDEMAEAIKKAADKFGYSPEAINEATNRVHASNMSKLGDDGKPVRREDGKILKGPNYKAPDLTDLV